VVENHRDREASGLKRLLAVLAFVVLLGALAGCGTPGDGEKSDLQSADSVVDDSLAALDEPEDLLNSLEQISDEDLIIP